MNTQARIRNRVLYLKMYRSLVGVGTLCGIIIVLVYQFSAPMIRENKKIALETAIFKILPDATTKKSYVLSETGNFILSESSSEIDIIYAGFNDQHQLIGFTIPARGMGYQDTIELLYAYEPIAQNIIGMVVLQSRETPGLGSRIEDDHGFLRNFEKLDVSLNAKKTELKNSLQIVKPGKKTSRWQIDSITGATVSANAVGKILQQSASQWLPAIKQHYEDFEFGH